MILNTHYPYIGGGGGKLSFEYTGEYQEIDDGGGNWRVKFLTSGTLTLKNNAAVDVFLVGGGGSGSAWGAIDYVTGGGGGYTNTVKKVELAKNTAYQIVVGEGGAIRNAGSNTYGVSGGSSSAFGYSASGGSGGGLTGGAGGSGGGNRGGSGGSNGSNGNPGGAGQGTTTREFGEATGDLYAGGGGGYGGAGGAGGGGNGGGGAGTPNTGGGAGGVIAVPRTSIGGSGIVVIRKAR